MTTASTIKHAAMLVAGVLLFAYGASRCLAGPVQVAERLLKAHPAQVVTVDP